MKKDSSMPVTDQAAAQISHATTMARIKSGMDRLGDLPIFSTSINKVRRASSDPQADAMAVAQEVLKDANLSTKLLRLANSAYYNRGLGKISVVSRAVIMLGFETVRNLTLTLKLIESFQNSNSALDMSRMLVRSYIAAGLVRDLASKCGIKDIEESYVCALLNNLGEIIVAYVLPQDYIRIQDLQMQAGITPAHAEHTVLGSRFDAISQDLAKTWEFPPLVVSSMSRAPMTINGASHDRLLLNRALSCLSNELVDTLYVTKSNATDCFSESLRNLATVTGLNHGLIENSFNDSFRMSCALAHDYGLDKSLLKPVLGQGEDNARDKWARQLSYYASASNDTAVAQSSASKPGGTAALNTPQTSDTQSKERGHAEVTAPTMAVPPVTAASDSPPAAVFHNAQLQLSLIQEITTAITQGVRLNQVFVKVLEGIQRGAGFDRALLCLVTPDRRNYVARLAVGASREQMKEYFSLPINPKRDYFSTVLLEGGEFLIEDIEDPVTAALLPEGFSRVAAIKSFVVAALSFDGKPVGFFYADRPVSGQNIEADDLRNMLNFVTQARLAMRLCT